jgi:phosphotransferase system HPr (HPr) family protein
VVVRSRDGLHARPCALIAAAARKSKSTLLVRRGKQEVDGKSIFALMTLVAGGSTRLELVAEGPDAETLLDDVASIIEAAE